MGRRRLGAVRNHWSHGLVAALYELVVCGRLGIAGAMSASVGVSNTPHVPYLLSGEVRAVLKDLIVDDKQIQYRYNSI